MTPSSYSHCWLAIFAALLFGLFPLVSSSEPGAACVATAQVSTKDAVVGQQIVYRVRISSRRDVHEIDWVAPERNPGFRTEWIPEQSLAEPEARGGVLYRVREERRALFPERQGELSIAASSVRCRWTANGAEEAVVVPVSELTIRVGDPPAIERPPEWKGLVGAVSLQLIAAPEEAHLGESVRLALMVRGSGNLWDLDDPLGPIADAEIFRRRPELRIETGPSLRVVKHFAYDVVPLQAGELRVPSIRVVIFDPASSSFATVMSESLTIPIHPRLPTATNPQPVDAVPPTTPAPQPAAAPASARHGWTIAAVAVAAGGLVLLQRRRSRAARGFRLATQLADLEPGRDTGAAYANALRASLERIVPAVSSLAAEEIAELPDLPAAAADAAQLLIAVDRARFDPHAPMPSRETIERALARL